MQQKTDMDSLLLPPCGQPGAVTRCHNLRPEDSPSGTVLTPAPLPVAVASGGWRPLAEIPQTAGDAVTVWTCGNSIALMKFALPASVVTLDSAPQVALPEAGHLIVMTQTTRYRFDVTSSAITGTQVMRRTLPRLVTAAAAGLAATVPAVQLRGVYDGTAPLSATDRQLLSDAAAALYRSLDANARAAGLWWMPAVAMVRVVDRRGDVVAVGPPQLLVHPAGVLADGAVTFTSRDGSLTMETTVEAPAWRASLLFPQNPCFESGDRIEVLSSPLLQRADPGAGCDVSLRRRADDRYLAVATPRASSTGVWPGAPASRTRLPVLVAERLELCGKVIASIPASAALASARVTLDGPAPGSPRADIDSVAAALSRTPSRTGSATRFAAPHTFVAHSAAVAGTTTLLAGITLRMFDGYAPDLLSTVSGDSPWHAAVRVTMADGHSVVATADGTVASPDSFGPMLSYPSPDAVSMEIICRRGNETRRGVFPLQRDSTGRRAVYIHPSLAPFTLPDTLAAYVVPEADMTAVYLPDTAVACRSGSLTPLAATATGRGGITAISPALHAQGAWDFGRARFYMFTASGILSMAVNAAGTDLRTSLIDPRIVRGPHAVVCADGAVMAIASGQLVRLHGASATTVCIPSAAEALAADTARGELWLVGRDNVEILCLDRGMARYTLGLSVDPLLSVTIGQTAYVADSDSSYIVGSERPALTRDVEWNCVVAPFPAQLRGRNVVDGRRLRVTLDAAGTVNSLTLALSRRLTAGTASAPEASYNISGRLASPFSRSYLTRTATATRSTVGASTAATLCGTVAPDFILAALRLTPAL